MKWFRYDSGFWAVMGRVFDWMLLNLLFLVTSLPLVTLGASLAALTDVSLGFARGEEPSVLRSYFRAWARHWKRATGLWLLWLAVVLWLGVSLRICLLAGAALLPVAVAEGALLLTALLTVPHLFAAVVLVRRSWIETAKAAIYAALKHLPWSLILALTAAAPVLVTVLLPQALPYAILFWTFVGAGGIANLQGILLNRLWAGETPDPSAFFRRKNHRNRKEGTA